jgi:hypothetical protein
MGPAMQPTEGLRRDKGRKMALRNTHMYAHTLHTCKFLKGKFQGRLEIIHKLPYLVRIG